MKWLPGMFGLLLLEAIADIFAVKFAQERTVKFFIFSCSFYLLCNISWLWALYSGVGLARGSALFGVASIILAFIVGVLLFNEVLLWEQHVGLVLGFISIYLLIK